MHNNANKVHFSCPVAAVKWPFQYFFWIKYSSEMEQNCFGLINMPFVTRVLIEGNCCCQWDGLVQVVRVKWSITLFSLFFKFMGEIQEVLTLHLGCVEY
jgi:hypothetical protein